MAVGAVARLLAPGYGWCFCCRRPWGGPLGVRWHMTQYGDFVGYRLEPRKVGKTWVTERGEPIYSQGCFPLCERCWQALGTPEARRPYYEMLMHEWGLLDERYEPSEKTKAKIAAIRQAVEDGR